MRTFCRTNAGCAGVVVIVIILSTALCGSGWAREPKTDLGITQQDDATMQWFGDAKFGMFLHWGVYAAPAHGEWYMEWSRVPIETYRKFATDQGDGVYFDAKDYDPAEWA